MKRPTTIQADGSHQWMNSHGVLTAATDNVLCSRLADATRDAVNASAGDSIDRGLALLAELKKQGFGVIYLGEPGCTDGVPPSDALTVQEHATQIAEALADLPAQLRAHPGIKRLYRAAVSGVTAAPASSHEVKLPPVPEHDEVITNGYGSGHSDHQLQEYARRAVLEDRAARGVRVGGEGQQ